MCRLLFLCAKWIREGPHLSAVEVLLRHQYDLSTVNSHSLLKWPQGSNPNWIGESTTPDPFFIELVRKCVENDPGEYVFIHVELYLTTLE